MTDQMTSQATSQSGTAAAAAREQVSSAQMCRRNGWGVGTLLRGYEGYVDGRGVWTTIRLTAIGENHVLARTVRLERVNAEGVTVKVDDTERHEGSWTLVYRNWAAVEA